MNETKKEIVAQIITATQGNASAVESMQTGSGIKDSIAQHWIDRLISKGRALREERLKNPITQDARLKDHRLQGVARVKVREEIEKGIENELLQWLVQQPAHRYNCLPEDSGTHRYSIELTIKVLLTLR